MAAILRAFDTCSTTKTFATYENAERAFLRLYSEADVSFIVVKLDTNNCNNAKHHGRYIPVAIGMKAIELGIHFNFHVVG